MSGIGQPRGRLFDHGYSPEQPAGVAELLLAFNAVAQIAALPDNDGFMIRVWPPCGTHEFGGNNSTVVSMGVRWGPDLRTVVDSIRIDKEWPERAAADLPVQPDPQCQRPHCSACHPKWPCRWDCHICHPADLPVQGEPGA